MKATDLMIGDWVSCGGKCYQIAEIGGMVCLDAEREIFASLEDVTPIPITPEILEKNGFTNKDDKLYKSFLLCVPTGHEKDSFTIQITLYKKPLCGVTTLFKCWGWIPPLQGGVNDLHICNLVSVHELQHALKLCGIDKEIII